MEIIHIIIGWQLKDLVTKDSIMEKILTVIVSLILFSLDSYAVSPELDMEANYFVDPVFWQAGDMYTTYQEWDIFSPPPNAPNEDGFYNVNPSGLILPSLMPVSPGFFSSTGFYSFAGDYSFYANIYNHGGVSGGDTPQGYGTHVVVQLDVTQNPDDTAGGDPNNPVGLFPESLCLMTLDDQEIEGGRNEQALRVDTVSRIILPSGGHAFDVYDEELIYEFYLPDYTSDFRIRANVVNHGNVKQVQVDTVLVPNPFPVIPIPGARDINNDNAVDIADFAIFSAHWMESGDSSYESCGGSDFDLNGEVELYDLLEFTYFWLENKQ